MSLEKDLLNRCISGEKQAWDEFVVKYSKLIYSSIIRTFNRFGTNINNDIIDDLHNDVFVTLLKNGYRALKVFEGRYGCSLASYLRTIAVNKVIDYFKKQKPTISLDADDDSEEGRRLQYFSNELSNQNIFDSFSKEDAINIKNQLFFDLKEEERQFCQLCFIDKLKPEEIAGQMEITVDNFYVRKQRILDKLTQIAKDKKIC